MRDARPIRAALILALTLGALGLLYWQAVETIRSNSRRIGFQIINSSGSALVTDVEAGLPAADAGLRTGDVLLTVDGITVNSLPTYGSAARRFKTGQPAFFHVRRGGGTVDLVLRPGVPFPIFSFACNALAALGFLLVARLAITQGLQVLRTRLLLGFSGAVALELLLPGAVTPVIGHNTVNIVARLTYALLTGVELAFELHLASLIPERPPWLQRRRWVVPLYYALGLALGGSLCATFIASDVLQIPRMVGVNDQALGLLNRWGLPLWALAVSLLLGSQAMRFPQPRGRHQAGLVLTATGVWLLFTLYGAIITSVGRALPPGFGEVQSLVLLLFPLALFAAVFRYHLFDIELAVKRGLLYTALSGALVLVFYAALGALSLLLPASFRARHALWAMGLAMLLLGLLFAPLRKFTHRLIDRGFFPERNELRQRLIGLAGELPSLGKLPLMGRHLVTRITEIFGSRSALLLIASPERSLLKVLAATGGAWEDAERWLLIGLDDPGIEPLERAARPLPARQIAARVPLLAHRLRDLDAASLAVPLLIPGRFIGALLVGGKGDGRPYPAEEQDLLALLAHHVASVFENARLFESATYESLTGLLRREAILEHLDREMERAQRYGRPLTLAMADLDYFKEVNDRYGHLAGDTLLKAISQAAADGLRSTDMIGRYGGEEFLVVLPETDIAGAVAVAEKIRGMVQDTTVQMEDGSVVGVTISIGLATLGSSEAPRQARMAARDLIAAADRSLYEAKNGGRNRVYPLVA